MICISPGNDKMGGVPSISLPPVTTCVVNVPCIPDCYARNMAKRWKNVRRSWENNLRIYQWSSSAYFEQLYDYFDKAEPAYFRFHVGGDCPDRKYLWRVNEVCSSFPATSFLMFTKRHSWAAELDPARNFNILFSMWPYMKTTDAGCRAWVRGDLRAPADAYHCKGICTECFRCWRINEDPTDILLKGH